MSTNRPIPRKPGRTNGEMLDPLGERVREQRKELGLSLEELATRTGLGASFLSLVERNINNPSLDSLYRIAEALDVPNSTFRWIPMARPVPRTRWCATMSASRSPSRPATSLRNCWCPTCATG